MLGLRRCKKRVPFEGYDVAKALHATMPTDKYVLVYEAKNLTSVNELVIERVIKKINHPKVTTPIATITRNQDESSYSYSVVFTNSATKDEIAKISSALTI